MNKPINIHDAKTQFSKLVSRAEAGEEIVIARGGKPVARIAPLPKKSGKRGTFGMWRGKIEVPGDFDAPLPDEVLDTFYNSPLVPKGSRR